MDGACMSKEKERAECKKRVPRKRKRIGGCLNVRLMGNEKQRNVKIYGSNGNKSS
jgi:hypothetical protein